MEMTERFLKPEEQERLRKMFEQEIKEEDLGDLEDPPAKKLMRLLEQSAKRKVETK